MARSEEIHISEFANSAAIRYVDITIPKINDKMRCDRYVFSTCILVKKRDLFFELIFDRVIIVAIQNAEILTFRFAQPSIEGVGIPLVSFVRQAMDKGILSRV